MKRKGSENNAMEKERLSKLLFRPSNFVDNFEVKSEDETDYVHKKPAWVDEDDEEFPANAVMETKCKDLYANTLKQKYVNLIGTPDWAKLNRIKREDSDGEDDQILRTVGHLYKKKKPGLNEGKLEMKRFPKINSETGNEGPIIKTVQFHPTSSVALVAGQSGVVSLFTIGGDVNKKLHSVSLPNFRIFNGHFTPDGSEALLCSDKNHNYCVYNLVAAKASLVQLPRFVKEPSVFELSPCGKYLAVADGFDEIHIICAVSRELIKTLKQNSKVEAISFSADSKKMYSFGVDGVVIVWNLISLRVEHKFADEGCVTASCITTSACGRLLATGSGEGIVNVYNVDSLTVPNPKPVRTVDNLRTKITSVKFNASSEILGLASSYYPNAMKLVHIPSYHVFSNFPERSTNLHQIASFNFSPNSGFLALGNNKNCAYLYRLKYFKNY